MQNGEVEDGKCQDCYTINLHFCSYAQ